MLRGNSEVFATMRGCGVMIPPEAQRPAFPLRSCTEEEGSPILQRQRACGAWVPQAALHSATSVEGPELPGPQASLWDKTCEGPLQQL